LSVTPERTLAPDDGPSTRAVPAGADGRHRDDRLFLWVAVVAGAGLVAFLLVVVLRGAPAPPAGRFPTQAPASLAVGTTAPSFSLARLGGGAPVSLATFRGAPVVLSFFASWCPHCRADLASFASASGRVAVVGVDTNDGQGEAAARLLRAVHATYAVGLDPTATVASQYRIEALPVTYFLDARDRIQGVAFGQLTTARLDALVTTLLHPAP